ncbi:response regulator [Paremcibacter congregatus]|uniref:response regulator n=1 Tax=Paremcibacter congregatus TaxID=2043170 RepID=UPI0030EF2949|tara:strand:- start:5311 stop:5679 length:369 start_codon:yes stop_codon:yes gene_type:complete
MAPQILLVEDNEMNRDMLQRRLNRKGFDVAVAVDGYDALTAISKLAPDLILMDVGLPQLDGLATTRQLKSQASTQHIPIIMLTANAMEEDRKSAFAAGCDDFETKPINFARLLEKISQHLGR